MVMRFHVNFQMVAVTEKKKQLVIFEVCTG